MSKTKLKKGAMVRAQSLSQIRTIAIVGLGLMGGSLAAVLRKKMPAVRIVGVSRSKTALNKAIRQKWIHEGHNDLERGVQKADLIVLCTPVQTFAAQLKRLMKAAPKGALVTDVGSVKKKILKQQPRQLADTLYYVSAHPMVGSHDCGIDAVNPALYDRGFAFLIKEPRVSKAAYRCIKAFWGKVIPRVIEITAAEHDRVTAEISHMPHAVAACLIEATSAKALPYGSRGFRDMTRLAAGSPHIWLPIFEANREEVSRSLDRLSLQIRSFKQALKSKSNKALRHYLTSAELKRKQL